jgi:hypothetical protein
MGLAAVEIHSNRVSRCRAALREAAGSTGERLGEIAAIFPPASPLGNGFLRVAGKFQELGI